MITKLVLFVKILGIFITKNMPIFAYIIKERMENHMDKYQKILGGLLAAAVADAMGAATETRTTEQIKEKFNGLVKDFVSPPNDVFAKDFPKGSVTDDFSLAYETAKEIVRNKGVVDYEVAKNALINWSKTPYYSLAGPTTVATVNKMIGKDVLTNNNFLSYDSSKGTDGGAMKISPVGIISNGDISKAIKDAITICMPTHFNSTALSGATAVAAACSEAMNEKATIDSIIEAGLKGAFIGEEFAKKNGKDLANPSVFKRIKLAVEIGKKYKGDDEKAMKELADVIGSGILASEAVPCAFGILAASDGDTRKAIFMGVNIGGDTDTVATMAAAMSGIYEGYYDEKKMHLIDEINSYNLSSLARKINEVING